jgi:type VI secretion system secreted protein Hcp
MNASKICCTLLIALSGVLFSTAACAQLTAYLIIDGIPGESNREGYAGAIDLSGYEWGATNESSAQVGRGRARARAQVDTFFVEKFGDSASVYLKLATLQGRSFERVRIDVLTSGDKPQLKIRYDFENVLIAAFETDMQSGEPLVKETVGLVFENVRILYIETNEDGSAGDEHEITYDLAAGV